MTNTPATTTAQPPATATTETGNPTYVEWVTKQIRESKWYIGDGGFIAQAMNAETIEEATKTGEMISGRDHPGVRFRWLNASFADSELDGALPLFAVCDVIDPSSGAVEKLTVGGARVTATLFRACEKEWFPFEASLEAVDMGAGKAALNLVLAPTKVENKSK